MVQKWVPGSKALKQSGFTETRKLLVKVRPPYNLPQRPRVGAEVIDVVGW
jgi:hypothetical protein